MTSLPAGECTDWTEGGEISPAVWGQQELNEGGVAPPLSQRTESSEEDTGGWRSQAAGLLLLWGEKKNFTGSFCLVGRSFSSAPCFTWQVSELGIHSLSCEPARTLSQTTVGRGGGDFYFEIQCNQFLRLFGGFWIKPINGRPAAINRWLMQTTRSVSSAWLLHSLCVSHDLSGSSFFISPTQADSVSGLRPLGEHRSLQSASRGKWTSSLSEFLFLIQSFLSFTHPTPPPHPPLACWVIVTHLSDNFTLFSPLVMKAFVLIHD